MDAADRDARPRNILLLMADQWRWDTIFQPGHPCQTPNLRRLASEGVAFDNAFSCVPLCCPARGSLLTGLWPHQTSTAWRKRDTGLS